MFIRSCCQYCDVNLIDTFFLFCTGVGFRVGGTTGINYIVIQLHYAKKFSREYTGFDKFQRKNVNIFLPISFNICFGCSKEPSD